MFFYLYFLVFFFTSLVQLLPYTRMYGLSGGGCSDVLVIKFLWFVSMSLLGFLSIKLKNAAYWWKSEDLPGVLSMGECTVVAGFSWCLASCMRFEGACGEEDGFGLFSAHEKVGYLLAGRSLLRELPWGGSDALQEVRVLGVECWCGRWL